MLAQVEGEKFWIRIYWDLVTDTCYSSVREDESNEIYFSLQPLK